MVGDGKRWGENGANLDAGSRLSTHQPKSGEELGCRFVDRGIIEIAIVLFALTLIRTVENKRLSTPCNGAGCKVPKEEGVLFVMGEDREGVVQILLEHLGFWDHLKWTEIFHYHNGQYLRKNWTVGQPERDMWNLGSFPPHGSPPLEAENCFCYPLEIAGTLSRNVVLVYLAPDPCQPEKPIRCQQALNKIHTQKPKLFVTSATGENPLRLFETLSPNKPLNFTQVDFISKEPVTETDWNKLKKLIPVPGTQDDGKCDEEDLDCRHCYLILRHADKNPPRPPGPILPPDSTLTRDNKPVGPISKPGYTDETTETPLKEGQVNGSRGNGLPTWAVATIVLGVLLLLFIPVAVFVWYKHKKDKHDPSKPQMLDSVSYPNTQSSTNQPGDTQDESSDSSVPIHTTSTTSPVAQRGKQSTETGKTQTRELTGVLESSESEPIATLSSLDNRTAPRGVPPVSPSAKTQETYIQTTPTSKTHLTTSGTSSKTV